MTVAAGNGEARIPYVISNVDLKRSQFTTCPRMATKSSEASHDGVVEPG